MSKVIMPDEVEAKNIITKRELSAVIQCLKLVKIWEGRCEPMPCCSRSLLSYIDSVAPKIQRVYGSMK